MTNEIPLPEAALKRIERMHTGASNTSMLSVAASYSLADIGFDTVGEAMGCAVMNTSGVYYPPCRMYNRSGGAFQISMSPWGASYQEVIDNGWSNTKARIREEARLIGADGVIGITISRSELEPGAQEFLMVGTAIRSRGSTRSKRPFLTSLKGNDFAKLIASGWITADLLVDTILEVAHNDYSAVMQNSLFAANTEIDTFTRIVNNARNRGRDRHIEDVGRIGASGSIISHSALRIFHHEPAEGHVDFIAETTIIGSALTHFNVVEQRPTLRYISLKK
ncbi:MAG: heavy metal-binding domain-containing protein [Actinomycetota bacterium]|nr:heavy metal-binding domain-containing protein [Actinomycetota bacterium]